MGADLFFPFFLLAGGQEPAAPELSAVATFESIGLYWKAPGGSEDKSCGVRYRPAGKGEWKEGFPLWFDARNSEYRGSLVHLRPGTEYEIVLSLTGSPVRASLRARTWSETFPVAERVPLPAQSSETLVIRQSGTPAGYRWYGPPAGAGTATIDAAGRQDVCVKIEASYVILHGLTLRNARIHAILLEGEVHDVVIEECDISGWGRVAEDGWGVDYDAAVYARHPGVRRIVVQRNRIHHPRSNSNNWRQARPRKGKRESNHPEGPQAVCFWDSEGNHVIRHNAVFSDDGHYYNDILGAGHNFSTRGFPHRDTDIYGNLLSGDPPPGHEKHGVRGVPQYAVPPVLEKGRGVFWLSPQSPGLDAGTLLPGFNDGFQGRAPDLGAHEAGSPPMEFGPGDSPGRPAGR